MFVATIAISNRRFSPIVIPISSTPPRFDLTRTKTRMIVMMCEQSRAGERNDSERKCIKKTTCISNKRQIFFGERRSSKQTDLGLKSYVFLILQTSLNH